MAEESKTSGAAAASGKAGAAAPASRSDAHQWRLVPDFAGSLVFRNRLPPPPTGPFLEDVGVDLASLVEYKTTSLEMNHKWDLHCLRNMGMTVDLIDPRSYNKVEAPVLAQEDQNILDFSKGRKATMNADTRSWLVSTKTLRENLYAPSGTKSQTLEDDERRKAQAAEEALMNTSRTPHDVQNIEASFRDAKARPRHPTDPSAEVAWSAEVLPDEALWGNSFQLMVSEDDPSSHVGGDNKRRRVERAIVSVDRHLSDVEFSGALLAPEDGGGDTFAHLRNYVFQLTHVSRPWSVFLVDEARKSATYVTTDARLDFRRSRAPEKAKDVAVQLREENDHEKKLRRGREAALQIHGRDWEADARYEEEAREEEDAEEPPAEAPSQPAGDADVFDEDDEDD